MSERHPKGDTISLEVTTTRLASLTLAVGFAILHSGCMANTLPLNTPPNTISTAVEHNTEGITHYKVGQWSIAREHFTSAIDADPHLAEAHFNLALTLTRLKRRSEATMHFKKAGELAPNNKAITQSRAYKSHTVPWSTYGLGGTKSMRVY